MAYIDEDTRQRVNIHATFKGFSKLDTPEIRERAGVIEVADPTPPEDFSDDTYYVTHQNEAPYVVYTRKSDEQIAQAKNAKLQQQIDAEEGKYPRAIREFMLGVLEDKFTPEQLAANVGYTRVKALDDKVAELRRQIVVLP